MTIWSKWVYPIQILTAGSLQCTQYGNDHKYCECSWFGWLRFGLIAFNLFFRMCIWQPDHYVLFRLSWQILGVITMYVWSFTSLYFFIENQVEKPHCVDLQTDIVDGAIISIFLLIDLLIILFLISQCIQKRFQRLKKEEFACNLKKVYENVYSHDFNVEVFIATYQKILDELPISQEEYAIIKDRYTAEYDAEQTYVPDECCICISEFDNKQLLFKYPVCNHTFHFDCISEWLKQKMICPYCKNPIRASILRDIVQSNPNKNDNISTLSIKKRRIQQKLQERDNKNVKLQEA